MKALSLFLVGCLAATTSFAQQVPIDFETGGNGASWTWTVFENDANPPLEIVANPDMTGANTSATVAKFTALQSGMPFAGCESMHGSDIGTFSLTASTSTIRIAVWKTEISDVGIKLVEPNNGSLGEIKVPNTVVNQWEVIEFDFSAMVGITYDQIVVFPDFQARTADNVVYFDNIDFGAAPGTGNPPMVAAPAPTIEDSLVLSLFSDAYTDVAVDTWQTPWSVGVTTDVMIDNNPTKLFSSLEFVGVETTGANLVDATDMETFHIDVWSENMTEFRIKLVDFGADAAFDGGDDTEHEITYSNPAQGSWISYEIPLADFTNLGARNNLAQFIFSAQPAGSAAVYADNIFFSRPADTTAVDTTTTDTTNTGIRDYARQHITLFPNPTNNVVTITAEETISGVVLYNLLGEQVMQIASTQNNAVLDLSSLPQGTYIAQVHIGQQRVTRRLVKR